MFIFCFFSKKVVSNVVSKRIKHCIYQLSIFTFNQVVARSIRAWVTNKKSDLASFFFCGPKRIMWTTPFKSTKFFHTVLVARSIRAWVTNKKSDLASFFFCGPKRIMWTTPFKSTKFFHTVLVARSIRAWVTNQCPVERLFIWVF